MNAYDEDVESIRMGFEYELCAKCNGDLDDHTIAPGPFGQPIAWCNREGS